MQTISYSKNYKNKQMIINEKSISNEIQTIFESDNESLIHDTISYIHENGTFDMIPLLFDVLSNTPSETIQNDIYDCLTDTKDAKAIPLIVESLVDSRFINSKHRLISVLWKTNLDISAHVDVFTESLLHDNYETAIEAFTAIEQCSPNLSEEKRAFVKKQFQDALVSERSEKIGLFRETIQILE